MLLAEPIRKAEQIARYKFELAKRYNFKLLGDKSQSFNVNVNAVAFGLIHTRMT